MINAFYGWSLSVLILALGVNLPTAIGETDKAQNSKAVVELVVSKTTISERVVKQSEAQIMFDGHVFKWGDTSWLGDLATRAGWPQETHETLKEIILRESGGCPNRRGGDKVDKHCNITGVSEWNHRSDTGLLQINGVNYDPNRSKWAIACREMGFCSQKPLLNPLNNLRVGYLLYQHAGWGPWDPCQWGDQWKHRCKKTP